MYNVGTRCYRYDEDGTFLLFKIVKVKEQSYTLKGMNNKSVHILIEKDLKEQYIILAPDALMTCVIANSSTAEDDKKNPREDVITSVYKLVPDEESKTSSIDGIPALVMRQDVYSASKNMLFSSLDTIYVGDCVNRNMVGNDQDILDFIECGEIKVSTSISLYIDDKFDDIFKVIPREFVEAADKVMQEFIKSQPDTIKGVSKSFKDLFIDNLFIAVYRQMFNIMALNFPIELNSSNEVIVLNAKQHKKLEDLLRKHIKIYSIIKYDKDIDISKVVNYNHIMVSDINDIIYMVVYDVIDEYPVDNDIASALLGL